MTYEHSFGSELMEMYLTFDDSTQKQELLRCWSELYCSLTTVHTRSTTFKLLPTLSPDPPFRTDDQSEENRGDLSAKARSRLHSSNHHNRQQHIESHWKVHIHGQHDITEYIDWRRYLGTDWQSERVVRQTHQAPLERTRSAASYQNQCVLCGCSTNTAVWVWVMDSIPPTHTETRPVPRALLKAHRQHQVARHDAKRWSSTALCTNWHRITHQAFATSLVWIPCEDGRWPHPQGRVLRRTGRRSSNTGRTTKAV